MNLSQLLAVKIMPQSSTVISRLPAGARKMISHSIGVVYRIDCHGNPVWFQGRNQDKPLDFQFMFSFPRIRPSF
jgi:hypothetical protein